VGFVSVAFVVSGLTFGWVFSRQQGNLMRAEFRKRGETLVRSVAANGRLDVWAGNRERLQRLVSTTLEEPDVIAVGVYDARGEVLARREKSKGGSSGPGQLADGDRIEVVAGSTDEGLPKLSFRTSIVLQRDASLSFELGEAPPPPGPAQTIGIAEVVLGLGAVEHQIEEVQRTVLRITAVIVGLGILSVVLLSRIFIAPIERIAATARRIAAGERGLRAEVHSRDELGELASAFDAMTEQLANQEEELRRMNLVLEQKVRERTAELEQKQRELVAANVELERANRLKSEFLANMSHELRTPLNAVNGFSELLLEEIHGPLTPKQRRYVENILGSGRHLLQLINDILDLSKIEAGRMEVFPEEFSFRQVVDNATSVIQPLAQKKGLEVEVRVDPRLDRVRLDPGKTRQVLYNLLSNAVKFTDRGKVTVTATPIDASWLELVVADTGIGIKPEDQARIFREFEQVDGSHSRRYEGTGLGLALTRKLVELQGGTIRVESEVGRGSRFIVQLPVRLGNP
jgi:signal transduction histidine kinase